MSSLQIGAGRDPSGSLFLINGRVLRGIAPEFQEYYTGILANPAVENMLGSRLVETSLAPDRLEPYPLVLEHRKITPASYCYEWPMPMLQDAALLTLDICLELNDSGAVLKDATPWNVLFDGARPLWVDFTSIMPQEKELAWVAADQYCRLFLFPLLIGGAISGRAARALLLDSTTNGVRYDEVVRYLPKFAWLSKPWLINRLYFPRMMIGLLRQTGQEQDLDRLKLTRPVTTTERKAFFDALKKETASIHFAPVKKPAPEAQKELATFFMPERKDEKQRAVAGLLAQYHPESVVDIGCGLGGYAILAAQAGAQVTAFDIDEDAVSQLYRLARQRDLKILPLVGDLLNPSPQCGWRAQEFPPAPQRLRAQMALALGLTHDLAINQIQTFERIALTLSDYCEKWLITEFIPLDDPLSKDLLQTNLRDLSWYSLDAFTAALRTQFSQVETLPSSPQGRVLCFCQK